MRGKRILLVLISLAAATLLILVSGVDAKDQGDGKGAQAAPTAGKEPQKPGPKEPAAPPSGKININKADVAQLSNVPGIGQKTAERIKEYIKENGEFKKLEELKKVKGVGEKNFEKIKPYIEI